MEIKLELSRCQITLPQLIINHIRRLVPSPTGCLIWNRNTNAEGYGRFKKNGKERRIHRVIVAIRDNLDYDDPSWKALHSCDNPSCVNEQHLRAGTTAENLRDAVIRKRNWQSKKTHCAKGHEYTIENTYHRPGADAVNHRSCRTCQRLSNLASQKRRANAKKEITTSINSNTSPS